MTHLTLFLTVFMAFMFAFNWPEPLEKAHVAWKFNWHPVLMICAFVLFMGEALIAFRILPLDRYTQKVLHLSLQTVALGTATVGVVFIFDFHTQNKLAHFYNIHSTLGLAALCLFVVQYVLGVTAFFFPRFSDSRRAALMPYHKYIGICLFFFIWCALLSGLVDRERIQFPSGAGLEFSPTYRFGNALGMMIALSGACIIFHFSAAAKDRDAPEAQMERLL